MWAGNNEGTRVPTGVAMDTTVTVRISHPGVDSGRTISTGFTSFDSLVDALRLSLKYGYMVEINPEHEVVTVDSPVAPLLSASSSVQLVEGTKRITQSP